MPAVMDANASETIGTAQAARLLGLSEQRVRQLADAGELPSMRTPLGRLFDRGDVEALAEAREQAQRRRVKVRQVR